MTTSVPSDANFPSSISSDACSFSVSGPRRVYIQQESETIAPPVYFKYLLKEYLVGNVLPTSSQSQLGK